MKEFPCCPTAKEKRESGKAGTRQVARGPTSSAGLREEHASHTQRKHFALPWLESPGPPCPGEHPSAQTSLGALQPVCRWSPAQVTWGQGDTASGGIGWSCTCCLWDSSLQGKGTLEPFLTVKAPAEKVPWTCTISSLPWNPSFCLKEHIWLGSSKGSPSYLNSALKSSWQMPGMHRSKRKQMLVCSSRRGWGFTVVGRMGTSSCSRHLQDGWSRSSSSTHLPVHDMCATATADTHPSDIPKRGSGPAAIFPLKVGNRCSE